MALTKINDRGLETPIDLLDGEVIRLGTGNDLQLYHDGNHSYIQEGGTGKLRLLTNSFRLLEPDNSTAMIAADENAQVELYYNGSKKFETNSGGCTLTGTLTTTAGINAGNNISLDDSIQLKLGTDDDVRIYHNGADLYIDNDTGGTWIGLDSGATFGVGTGPAASPQALKAVIGAQVELMYNGTKMFETASYGAGFTSNVRINADNASLQIGAGQDLKFYHDGSDSFIVQDGTGQLFIKDSDNSTPVVLESTHGVNVYQRFWHTGHANNFIGYEDDHFVVYTKNSGASTHSKRINVDQAGLAFNNDTAAANRLNDYEEGTFTPNWVGTTSAGSTTYNANDGSYTKIGNLVHIRIYSNIASTTGTGSWQCNNLPFVGASGNDHICTGSCMTDGFNLPSGYSWMVPYKNSGTSNLDLFASGDDVGWDHVGMGDDSTFSIILGVTYAAA